ncbi:unnamed protein product [Ascophyllum nodosum]
MNGTRCGSEGEAKNHPTGRMEIMTNAQDILRVVALSGLIRPEEVDIVCLNVCNACRESVRYAITVNIHNAPDILSPKYDSGNRSERRTRLKHVRRISRLNFRMNFPLTEVVWPDDLHELKFGWAFNQPLESALPSSLLSLDLGGSFNHHVEEVIWPSQLVKLRFGDRFNRPIELAAWPSTLRSLTFGLSFNQPIEMVKWPTALEYLALGDAFNHPVKATSWRATNLRKLEFGMAFRHPIDGMAWPEGLETLTLGACFDQALDLQELPRSLKVLQLPDLYEMDGGDHTFRSGLPNLCKIEIQEVLL